MSASATRALVLGGGGVTGVAWETGLVHGLERRGIRLEDADHFVGTSAGSVVATQAAAALPFDQLYRGQLDAPADELAGKLTLRQVIRLALAMRGGRSEQDALAAVGRLALQARTVPEPVRRAMIAQRLGVDDWPTKPLQIASSDASTGEFIAFDKRSGVDIVDAVGASCAVPTVWPPVTIGSARYIDGGIRSIANVDLAAGHECVVVIAPVLRGLRSGSSPADQLGALQPSRSVLVTPDSAAKKLMGRDTLDPRARAASARAGLEQADRVADQVGAVWG